MKHLSEWHTCDRCGVEIEYNYSTIINTKTQKTSYSLGICGVLLNSKTSTEEKIMTYALNAGKSLRSG